MSRQRLGENEPTHCRAIGPRTSSNATPIVGPESPRPGRPSHSEYESQSQHPTVRRFKSNLVSARLKTSRRLWPKNSHVDTLVPPSESGPHFYPYDSPVSQIHSPVVTSEEPKTLDLNLGAFTVFSLKLCFWC